jgi:uncharacterized protein (DUF983 family)
MTAPGDRSLLPAVARGFLGRCPACGRGAVLAGYIKPAPRCLACGENLAPYQTADFAPYLVTFAIGLIFMPLIVVMALREARSVWILYAFMAAALISALALLPRAKGAAIGILWALDAPAPS